MNDFNNCNFTGRIGKKPERVSDSVIKFSLANSKSWRDKNTQEWKEHTNWLRCVAFGYTAEKVETFDKGEFVIVNASVQVRPWETKDGQKRESVEFIVNTIMTAPTKVSNNGGGTKYSSTPENYDDSDDVPF